MRIWKNITPRVLGGNLKTNIIITPCEAWRKNEVFFVFTVHKKSQKQRTNFAKIQPDTKFPKIYGILSVLFWKFEVIREKIWEITDCSGFYCNNGCSLLCLWSYDNCVLRAIYSFRTCLVSVFEVVVTNKLYLKYYIVTVVDGSKSPS